MCVEWFGKRFVYVMWSDITPIESSSSLPKMFSAPKAVDLTYHLNTTKTISIILRKCITLNVIDFYVECALISFLIRWHQNKIIKNGREEGKYLLPSTDRYKPISYFDLLFHFIQFGLFAEDCLLFNPNCITTFRVRLWMFPSLSCQSNEDFAWVICLVICT